MLNWFRLWWGFAGLRAQPIPDAIWLATLRHYPFLADLHAARAQRLRALATSFLHSKEFSGAAGLVITDAMAVAIAAQACLPLLDMGDKALKLYDDFKGIVVHPGAMLARRQRTDAAGVVHHYQEILSGEAMERGPVTLSWEDVAASNHSAGSGHNVVIHEFIHKMDMRDGGANGCPPLGSRARRETWQAVMVPAFKRFSEQVVMAERFGAEPPWLNSYGAQSPVEFFAVAAEAYFVSRQRFEQDFADVTQLFDTFFGKKWP